MPFSSVNRDMNKKELAKLIDECFRKLGLRRTVVLIDDLKEIGFKYATRAGISICISDMHIPSKKAEVHRPGAKRSDGDPSPVYRRSYHER